MADESQKENRTKKSEPANHFLLLNKQSEFDSCQKVTRLVPTGAEHPYRCVNVTSAYVKPLSSFFLMPPARRRAAAAAAVPAPPALELEDPICDDSVPRMRAPTRNLCFTYNNYDAEDKDELTMRFLAWLEYAIDHGTIKYYVFGKEVGAEGTYCSIHHIAYLL